MQVAIVIRYLARHCTQVRAGDASPGLSEQWYCFDDVNVDSWDAANLDRDCFGGKYTLNPQHFKGAQQVGHCHETSWHRTMPSLWFKAKETQEVL